MLRYIIIFQFCLSIVSYATIDSNTDDRYVVKLFDFDASISSECNEDDEDCYSIDQLVNRALNSGLESLQKIHSVFRARERIKVSLGNILPNITVGATIEKKSMVFDPPVPFFGFLSPSRWKELKESKYLCEAEKESLSSLLANQAQAVIHLYFDSQMQIWSLRVLDFYIAEVDRLMAFLKNEMDNDSDRVMPDHIAFIKNIRARLEYDRSFMDGLSSTLPRIATAIGLTPDIDWATLKLAPYRIDTKKKKKLFYVDLWEKASARSTEVRNVMALIKAAEQNKKAVAFSIFDIFNGISIGFGYNHQLKIARSNIASINIQLEQTRMELSNAIQDSLNYYTESTNSLPWLRDGIESLSEIRKALEENLNNKEEPFKIQLAIRYLDMAENQALRYVHAYFVYRMARADLDRYTWNGKYYRIVRQFIERQVPIYLDFIKHIKNNKKLNYKRRKKK